MTASFNVEKRGVMCLLGLGYKEREKNKTFSLPVSSYDDKDQHSAKQTAMLSELHVLRSYLFNTSTSPEFVR